MAKLVKLLVDTNADLELKRAMSQTLKLSDEVYEALAKAAREDGHAPAEWVAMKLRQQLSAPRKGSPDAILQAMREPPHLTSLDVGALEESIATGKLPVRWEPVFDGEMGSRP